MEQRDRTVQPGQSGDEPQLSGSPAADGARADKSAVPERTNVIVEMHSLQDGQEAVHARFLGELVPKGRALYVRYSEQDDMHGAVRTTIRWNGEEISLIRRGGIESEQTFAAGSARQGSYSSAHLAFRLTTETEELAVEDGKDGRLPLTLRWAYRLRVEDQLSGRFQLRLHIQEDTHS